MIKKFSDWFCYVAVFSKLFFITIFVTILQTTFAYAGDFYIKKGKQFELCKEVKQILDEPENRDYFVPFVKNSEFVIPKKYKNFGFPEWEDISSKDLPKYMKSGKYLNMIQDFNDQKRIIMGNRYPATIRYGKDYGVEQKFLIQKAYIDVDNNGKKEDVIRYKLDDSSIVYSLYSGWRNYISDVGIEPDLTDDYDYSEGPIFFRDGKMFRNPPSSEAEFRYILSDNYNKQQRLGTFFYYKGKIFQRSFYFDKIVILEPRKGWHFHMRYVCEIGFSKEKSHSAYKFERNLRNDNKVKILKLRQKIKTQSQ
ncbi:MAG: hypothetical protein ISQ34_03480 [Rickettsiales bacterium]|nr:hypothetical protein [Rickettsiales bacterium]